ncbi:hypothetical protein [Neomoorella thermoacetica]|uniref:hypothetical protein n=1 Tax=Neomoorella thermoacetica TaxID=1525 RepID=UPI0030CDB643
MATSFAPYLVARHRMEQGGEEIMGYQAPVTLLASVVSLALAYGWLWRRYQAWGLNYYRLVILVRNQGEYLEGLLRQFFSWRYWHGLPLELWVVVEAPCEATLAILHHFLYPYPCCRVLCVARDSPVTGAVPVLTAGDGEVLDLREETNFFRAGAKLYQVYSKMLT